MQRLKTVLVDDSDLGAKARAVSSFGHGGSFIGRPDGTILTMDEIAFRMLDLDHTFSSPAEVAGRRMADLVECSAARDVLGKGADAVSTATCLQHPVKTVRGCYKWLLCVQRRKTTPDGDVIHSNIWDVSPCRTAQKEREQEMAFYVRLFYNSSAATFVLDRKHRVVLWNKACEHLTGIKEADVIGTDGHWRAFYSAKRPCLADIVLDGRAKDLSQFYATHTRSAVLEDGWQSEGWFEDAAGNRRYLVFDAAPICTSEDGPIATVQTLEDITEHKLAEENLREKDEQLYQLQKMEALGRLAGGIAHDFNNILTSILGYAHLIKDSFDEADPRRLDTVEIIEAGECAAKLTRQLLALARKQMVVTQPVNINDTLIEMGRLLRRTLGEHIDLRIEVEPQVWTVMADPGLMEQVVMNLAVNARDAMPEGGRILIRSANVTLDGHVLEGDTGVSSGRYVAVSVRDTGCGMTEEVRAHIFEPFFTTKERGKGTGLGLSAVYGIVQQLKGHIDVASQPGMGTAVTIYLPAVDVPVSPIVETAPGELPGGPETVLVAEDERSLRNLVVRTLRGLGYNVIEAENGEEGVRLAKLFAGRIDLVLSDVVMPKLGGQEMVREIRAARRGVKVLFCSGFTNGALVDHGLLDGGHELILKPFTRKTLAQKVRKILDGR